jgi:hypothetical protein
MLTAHIIDAIGANTGEIALPESFRIRTLARWYDEDPLLANLQEQPYITGALRWADLGIHQFRLLIALHLSILDGDDAYQRSLAEVSRNELLGGLIVCVESRIEAEVTDLTVLRQSPTDVDYEVRARLGAITFPQPKPPRSPFRVVVDNTRDR